MAIYGWKIVIAVIGTFALVFGLLAMIDSAAPGETGLTGTPPSAPRARPRPAVGRELRSRSPDPVRTQAFQRCLTAHEQPVAVH